MNNAARIPRPQLLLVSVLLTLAATLSAQSLDTVLDRGAFSQPAREEIAALVRAASEAAIPEELLIPRIEEGIAKRVPPARIIATVRNEIARLEEARSVLLEAESPDLVTNSAIWARAANLLAAGVGRDEVKRIAGASRARPETFRPATTLLVSLIDWGVDESSSADLVVATVESRLAVDDYPIVLDLLIEGRISRVDVDDTIELLLELISEVDSARDLRRSMPW